MSGITIHIGLGVEKVQIRGKNFRRMKWDVEVLNLIMPDLVEINKKVIDHHIKLIDLHLDESGS